MNSFLNDIKLVYTDTPSRKYLVRKYGLGPLIRLASIGVVWTYPLLPKSWKTLHRPIFVLGCSRSGTDLFTNLFSMHTDLANWSEAAQVLDLSYYDPAGNDYQDPENATPFETKRLQALFGIFTTLHNKKRFVNKHPQNSLRGTFLDVIFPDSYYIHVIRDGRAVVHSNHNRATRDRFRSLFPFGNFPKPINWRNYLQEDLISQFAYQWRDVVLTIQEFEKQLSTSNRFITIKYEDLCADPHGVLRQVDEFCGLAPDGRLPSRIPFKLEAQNHKWQQDFDTQTIEKVETIINDLMKSLGYME